MYAVLFSFWMRKKSSSINIDDQIIEIYGNVMNEEDSVKK